MFTLESPHRGDSNEYTQYTISQYKKENHPKLSQICSYGILFQGTQERVRNSSGKEPPVFEPMKFYCITYLLLYLLQFENLSHNTTWHERPAKAQISLDFASLIKVFAVGMAVA